MWPPDITPVLGCLGKHRHCVGYDMELLVTLLAARKK
jgi:hypothetical protein